MSTLGLATARPLISASSPSIIRRAVPRGGMEWASRPRGWLIPKPEVPTQPIGVGQLATTRRWGLFQHPQRWSKEVSKKNSKRKRSAPTQPVNGQPDTLTYRCGVCGRETRVRTVRTPSRSSGWTSSGAQPSRPVRPARGESRRWHSPAVMSRRAAATIAAAAALGITRGEGADAPAA